MPSGGRRKGRARALLAVAALALGGCGTMQKLSDDFADLAKGLRQLDAEAGGAGFRGGLSTDEPRSTLSGRDVLAVGGNAVDAAVAVFFTQAVTRPSTSSLGGGGVCIVHSAPGNETMVIDFLARANASPSSATRRANGVPGNVAGFQALHARYGRLPWSQLVAPAEGLARFGVKVSRAFDHDLKKIGDALIAEPGARKIFAQPGGLGVLKEGDNLIQTALAETLGAVRTSGAAALYKDAGAARFAAAVTAGGGAIEAADLEGFRPVWRNAIEQPLGDISILFTPPPAAAGAVEAQIWAMMVANRRYRDTPVEARPHLFAEAAVRAFADRERWMTETGDTTIPPYDLVADTRMRELMANYRTDRATPAAAFSPAPTERPEDPVASTFAVMDADGSAVACALSMNGLFGNGLIAGDSGILMASIPGSGGRGPAPLGPMLAVDHFTNDFFFAGAASGGIAAPSSLLAVALSNIVDIQNLEEAVAAKRIHRNGAPDIVYHEQGMDSTIVNALVQRGHSVAATPTLGQVNAIGCTQGLPYDPLSCQAVADPRGYGLAIKVDN